MDVDNILSLPEDILLNIFKNLSIRDIGNLMLTCKSLKTFITCNNGLWRYVCKNKTIIRNRTEDRHPELLTYHNCRISQNWTSGRYRSNVLVQHKTNYMPWLKYNSDALLLTVGSRLQCYHVDNLGIPNCKRPLWKIDVPIVKRNDIRTNDISRFVWKNELLVCGNRDGSTAIYQINNIKRQPCLLQHIRNCHEDGMVEVSAVDVLNNRNRRYVVTGSIYSPDVQFWDLIDIDAHDNREESTTFTLDDYSGVRSLALNSSGNILAVGLKNTGKPILIDVEKKMILGKTEERLKKQVRDIQWHDENTVAYCNYPGILELMDRRTNQVVYHGRDPFYACLYCIKTDGCNSIVVGSQEYSRCVLYDTRRSLKHVQMYFTQERTSPVYSLDFSSSKLVVALDRCVALVNFNIQVSNSKSKDYSEMFYEVVK